MRLVVASLHFFKKKLSLAHYMYNNNSHIQDRGPAASSRMPCCSNRPAFGAKHRSPLHAALYAADNHQAPAFLSSKYVKSERLFEEMIADEDVNGHTVLMLAARDGQAKVVRHITSSAAGHLDSAFLERLMKQRDRAGHTSLVLAAMFGHTKIVKLLLHEDHAHEDKFLAEHLNARGMVRNRDAFGEPVMKGDKWHITDGRTPVRYLVAMCFHYSHHLALHSIQDVQPHQLRIKETDGEVFLAR